MKKKLLYNFHTNTTSLNKLLLSSSPLLSVVLQFFTNNRSLKQRNSCVTVAVNETVAYI